MGNFNYGIEYLCANEALDYLIAVNWYSIQIIGSNVAWIKKLTYVKISLMLENSC